MWLTQRVVPALGPIGQAHPVHARGAEEEACGSPEKDPPYNCRTPQHHTGRRSLASLLPHLVLLRTEVL